MKNILVNFLDVGQGDGTVILCPNGEMVLIDLGSKKNAEIAGADAIKAAMAMLVTSMSIRKSDIPVLDLLLVTHGDGDHYNLITQFGGYVRIMTGKDLVIKEVAIGGGVKDYDAEFQKAILLPAKSANALTLFDNSYHDPMATDGTVSAKWPLLNGGTAKLYVLSANFPYRETGAKNPKSVVVMLQYINANQRVILTGDAEGLTENAILGYYAANLSFLQSFALKLGHHGSQAGTTVPWIKAVKQLASFASADMKWAHPYCETVARVVETIGPGMALYGHKWLCGAGAGNNKEYRNWNDKNGFYSTMASMTHSPLQDPKDGVWYSPGLVQGVQYQLTLYEDGNMRLMDTLKGDSGIFNPARTLLEPAAEYAGCGGQ
jgi:competence protein ComEC